MQRQQQKIRGNTFNKIREGIYFIGFNEELVRTGVLFLGAFGGGPSKMDTLQICN